MRSEAHPRPRSGQATRRQASPRTLRITSIGYRYLLEHHARECRWCSASAYSCQEAAKLMHAGTIAAKQEQLREWQRRPELDRRIRRGDDFAGDAWQRGDELRYVAPGQVPT